MTLLALLPFALLVTACGADEPAPDVRVEQPLRGAQAQAPPPVTAAALTEIPNIREARVRVGYVNLAALADAPVPETAVLRAVLRSGGARVTGRAAGTAVQVDDATVVRARTRRVLGTDASLAARLAGTRPQESAITPAAQSAVQSCLGETVAQTILGPATMGPDAALGVGLAQGEDAPRGLQLRICAAPRFIRDIHAMERTLRDRFGDLGTGASAPRIGGQEIGEREIVEGVLPAGRLTRAQLVGLLAAGPQLRALAWR